MLRRRLLIALAGLLAAAVVLVSALAWGMRSRSPAVLRAVRRVNRRITNPYQMKTAGTPGAYASYIEHIGRRSGTAYRTPVVPFATEDGFVIALPYGASTDWLANVGASGSARLVTEGVAYEVTEPEVVTIAEVSDALPPSELRRLALFRVDLAVRLRRGEERVTAADGEVAAGREVATS